MIAVIADDFTGAAEIGGISIRQGYKAMIVTSLSTLPYDTDVLIVATNTRSASITDARKRIHQLTKQLLTHHPTFIYKKIDSVLRGNVAAELLEQLEASGKKRALIIPSNPALNRIIKDGIYYNNGIPLNRSKFAVGDTQQSPKVIDLLGPEAKEVKVIDTNEELPTDGLIVGNTEVAEDLNHWAKQLDNLTIMAGAAGFFNAILENLYIKISDNQILTLGNYRLYVCGSAFEESRQVVADAVQTGQYVAYMPSAIFNQETDDEQLITNWANQIIKGLNENGTVIIAVDVLENPTAAHLPNRISNAFAAVIKQVVDRKIIQELLIEGGQTAASIIEKLGYQKFYPVQELALGVIRMRVEENEDIFLTLKPGSYKWPAVVWER